MLPSVFALMQYTVLSQINSTSSTRHQPWQIRFATAGIVGIVLLYAGLQGFHCEHHRNRYIVHTWIGYLWFALDPTTVSIHKSTNRWQSCITSCISECLLSQYTTDSILGRSNNRWSIYGKHHVGSDVRIYHLDVIGNTYRVGPDSSPLEHPISSSMIIGTFFLSYAPIILFSLSLNLWHMNKQTNELHLQTDYQHQLLREMVVQNDATIQVTSQYRLTNPLGSSLTIDWCRHLPCSNTIWNRANTPSRLPAVQHTIS